MTAKLKDIAGRCLKKYKVGLSVLFLLLLGGTFWWKLTLRPVNLADKTAIPFVVEKGEGVIEISRQLKNKNLINDSISFRILTFLLGITKNLQAGNYYLSPSMGAGEVARALTKGKSDIKVTIVEGLRQEEIGEALLASGFPLNLSAWREEVVSRSLEGKLFPDTYFFPKEASQGAILKIIEKNYTQKVGSELKLTVQIDLSLKEILTLASIVEREANNEADRKIVAGILFKRWQNNWLLQADATVQYAVANAKEWWPKKLTDSDLKIKSPYNTYLYRGLPPGPICNPGLLSIRAVVNYEDSPYWFYLSDTAGKIHYASSDAEQAENIKNYLR